MADMAGYDQLFSTCTRALPAEPLLQALVVCSANSPDLCFDVDCGQHGSCDGGMCQCEEGYSGESCQDDSCVGVDCGEHGNCDGGICQCLAMVVFVNVKLVILVNGANARTQAWAHVGRRQAHVNVRPLTMG
eukprot:SAG31_NODE_3669_length_4005_cov_1.656938_3_plen_132_part_00